MPQHRTILVEDSEKIVEHSPYNELVPEIESAFSAYASGDVEMPDKSYVQIRKHNGDFRSMPAHIDTGDWEASGMKWVNVHPDNDSLPTVMAVVVYSDPTTGFPLAILNGTEITGRRTGAAAAVATDNLAPQNINSVGLIGAGAQAYEQVDAISAVRDFDTILVSDINKEVIQRFVEHFDDEYRVQSATPEEVSDCDVISTVTPATEPILDDVKEGAHINAMGADAPSKQEFSVDFITGEKVSVFVDDISQAMHSGEISTAVSSGRMSEEDVNGTLGEVINGDVSPETDTTLFDSTGLAIQDVATAHQVYNSLNVEEEQKIQMI